MNAHSVDPSSAAAKEPEAKPLFSDRSVTITNHTVIISGKQYSLSEIEGVSIQKDSWQMIVGLVCLAVAVYFYEFQPSLVFLVPWNNNYPKTVYSIFGLFFMVFFGWWGSAASKLIFKLPTGSPVVLKGKESRVKKIKSEIDRARIAATPIAPA